MLALCATATRAQTALDSPIKQWASEELIEAQMRRQFQESLRILPRRGNEDLHLMIEREGKRARRSVHILLVTCLILFFVFALPLFEHDEVIATEQLADRNKPH
jgi:hypothetical protein